jgi:hypothetical protein
LGITDQGMFVDVGGRETGRTSACKAKEPAPCAAFPNKQFPSKIVLPRSQMRRAKRLCFSRLGSRRTTCSGRRVWPTPPRTWTIGRNRRHCSRRGKAVRAHLRCLPPGGSEVIGTIHDDTDQAPCSGSGRDHARCARVACNQPAFSSLEQDFRCRRLAPRGHRHRSAARHVRPRQLWEFISGGNN